jgi:hypothetical protein
VAVAESVARNLSSNHATSCVRIFREESKTAYLEGLFLDFAFSCATTAAKMSQTLRFLVRDRNVANVLRRFALVRSTVDL